MTPLWSVCSHVLGVSPFWRRSALGILWREWCWSWNSSALATSCEELTHWKRVWCWEGLGAGGEGDARGWDGWMASLTRWTLSLSELREFVMDREAWRAVIHGVAKSRTRLSDWTELKNSIPVYAQKDNLKVLKKKKKAKLWATTYLGWGAEKKWWKLTFLRVFFYAKYLSIFLIPYDLEKEMAPHSSTLACKIPWMEEPDRLESMGSQRVGHDWVTSLSLHLYHHI